MEIFIRVCMNTTINRYKMNSFEFLMCHRRLEFDTLCEQKLCTHLLPMVISTVSNIRKYAPYMSALSMQHNAGEHALVCTVPQHILYAPLSSIVQRTQRKCTHYTVYTFTHISAQTHMHTCKRTHTSKQHH